jgi:hypothetical protein
MKSGRSATPKIRTYQEKLGSYGNVWTWVAIDPETKLVASFMVGNRSALTANVFMDDLAARLANRVQLTTDGHRAYLEPVEGAFGVNIDYAMLFKMYGNDRETKCVTVPPRTSDAERSRLQPAPTPITSYQPRRAPEPNNENWDAAFYPANKRIFKESRESLWGDCASLHAI